MSSSRRDFFRRLPVAVTVPASWNAMAAALQAATPDPADESYWQMVKRQFPLEEDLLYFNAANVCPASRAVLDRHLEYLRDFHANPSFQNREKYPAIAERLRGKLARLLNASADEIAITRNTSEGSNIVVSGLDLKAGDEVIVTAHNHPSNNDSWKVRARRLGASVRSLEVPIPSPPAEEWVDRFAGSITARTRVIAITHVTNVTGIQFPVREIATLARKHGVWLHLDGAQSFGALNVDLKALGCDSYSGSAHKWLMGPLEAGVLYVRADRIGQLWPSIVTAGWSDEVTGARKFEVFGQRDNPRFCGFEAAVDFVNLIGMPRIEQRMRLLAGHLREELAAAGVHMLTNAEPERRAGVVKFRIRGRDTRDVFNTLWKRHRLAASHTASGEAEGIRFSPHVYNTLDDVRQAVAAVRSLAG